MAREDSQQRTAGGWREAFLNRHRRSADGAEDLGTDASEASNDRRETRTRSISRPRANSRPPTDGDTGGGGLDAFNQQAVLEQDRALIEQLTQRLPRREGSAIRKPPPPPKVMPYRARSDSTPPSPMASSVGGLGGTAPPSPAAGTFAAEESLQADSNRPPSVQDSLTGAPAAAGAEQAVATTAAAAVSSAPAPAPAPAPAQEERATVACAQPEVPAIAQTQLVLRPVTEPVVPRAGELFTASDIDSIMNTLAGKPAKAAAPPGAPEVLEDRGQCTQNFTDVAQEFFRDHGMDVPAKAEDTVVPAKAEVRSFHDPSASDMLNQEFEVPQRKALKEQIQAIDSWLDEDVSARELGGPAAPAPGRSWIAATAPLPASVVNPSAAFKDLHGSVDNGAESEAIQKLEAVKRRKVLGERASPAHLKEIAAQVKPLLPGVQLERLVHMLRLFSSARHEDHDLYLRILGEIPVQVRGITPETLTTCVRVLWRLRLSEETYLELFSMEAMNMIRACRKPMARAPRRPPAPSRNVDAAATAALAGSTLPLPTPPPAPAQAPAPFCATQLLYLGNALSQLGSKHNGRFLEVYQDQLALAIPRLTMQQCELASPTLVMSQLMHDPLRRAFLTRCAEVDAGQPLGKSGVDVVGQAPQIAQYQKQEAQRRRRVKNHRNIFVVEASVRKETFSFFSSLPQEVRTYLDRLHADAASLEHEGPSALTSQIAAVLDQLGVVCDLRRMAGPLGLHIVAKATNPRAECEEIVYECSDTSAFYAVQTEDRGATPQLTTGSKLRHKLLQRLGVQLTHINVWEWNQLSEAHRINYMVKLQSLQ